jgi:hypothetical protein
MFSSGSFGVAGLTLTLRIDPEKFFDLWVEHYGAIDDSDKGLLPLKPVHFLAPRD